MLDKDYLNSINVMLSSRCPRCDTRQNHSVRANNSGDLVCGSCGHKYLQDESRPVFADGGLVFTDDDLDFANAMLEESITEKSRNPKRISQSKV